jgi:hypothetical protein
MSNWNEPTEVSVTQSLQFLRISRNAWVNPLLVVGVTDTPAAPGASVEHECTVWTLDDRGTTVKDTAENVVDRLLNGWHWSDE